MTKVKKIEKRETERNNTTNFGGFVVNFTLLNSTMNKVISEIIHTTNVSQVSNGNSRITTEVKIKRILK